MIVRVPEYGVGVWREDVPARPGSYLLQLRLEAPARLRVGALGERLFPAGLYVYCGSAMGPGGIRSRVRRHVEGARRLHWHVDFLLRACRVEAVWVREDERRLECEWARALGQAAGFCCPVPRFGSSDCRCRAHLWHTRMNSARLARVLSRLPRPPRAVRTGAPAEDRL